MIIDESINKFVDNDVCHDDFDKIDKSLIEFDFNESYIELVNIFDDNNDMLNKEEFIFIIDDNF